MFAQLTAQQTGVLLVLAMLCTTYAVSKVIDSFDKRGERAHERFITVSEAKNNAPDVVSEDVYRLTGSDCNGMGIIDKHAGQIRDKN
jgi:hypothetical protein